jgi:hypothetical protein
MCCIPAVLHVRIVDMRLRRLRSAWLGLALALGSSEAHDQPEYTFGTTVVDSFGFAGRVVHKIKVAYFQGPRFTVALVLAVSPPGNRWRIINRNDFKAS